MQTVFITDLDGTLLGHEEFDIMPSKPVLDKLIRGGIDIILASSKTKAEIETLCDDLGYQLPFIYENGAGTAYFDKIHKAGAGSLVRPADRGIPIPDIQVRWLQLIPSEMRQYCRFLDEMDRGAQKTLLGLRGADLDRALRRSYSCLFVFTGSLTDFTALQAQAKQAGLSVQRGGRVCTLSGHHNKAVYLPEIRCLTQQGKQPSVLVGFGDSDNDKEMLDAVDIACVIPRPDGYTLSVHKARHSTIIAPCVAPWGWHEAAVSALSLISEQTHCTEHKGASYG